MASHEEHTDFAREDAHPPVPLPWGRNPPQVIDLSEQQRAAERMAATSPHPVRSLGALQSEQRGDYDAPKPRRRWWGPADTSAKDADALVKALQRRDADVQEGVNEMCRAILQGLLIIAVTALVTHLLARVLEMTL